MWLQGWCNPEKIEFVDPEMIYSTPGLLTTDARHLSQRGKRLVAQELGGFSDRDSKWFGRGKGIKPGSPARSDGTVC